MPEVEILVNPVQAQIITLDSGLVQILDDKFKFKDPKLAFGKRTRELIARGVMDEFKHLFSKKTQRLPIGFLQEAIDIIKANGFTVKIEDLRKEPEIEVPEDYNTLITGGDEESPSKFRYYQEECFDAILKDKKFNGVVEGATGFGKTLVFLALTRMIKGQILIIFPGVDLVFQTKEKADELGLKDIGFISGNSALVNKRVMLVNYQSLQKINNPKDFKTVFVDEMHTAKANTLYKFLKKVPATIRLGFSGTPYVPFKSHALDNAMNKASFGEIVYRKKAESLIDEGFLSSVNINFLRIKSPYDISFEDHIVAVEKGIINNKFRNEIIAKLAIKDDKKTLIMIERREHGENLMKLLPDALYVNGDTEKQDRKEIAKALNDGGCKIVICTRIWNAGIDIPELQRIIVGASGKSFYQGIQRVGRGLRKTEEASELEMWDFIDITNKYLYRWSKQRWKIYRSEKYPITSVKIEEITG